METMETMVPENGKSKIRAGSSDPDQGTDEVGVLDALGTEAMGLAASFVQDPASLAFEAALLGRARKPAPVERAGDRAVASAQESARAVGADVGECEAHAIRQVALARASIRNARTSMTRAVAVLGLRTVLKMRS